MTDSISSQQRCDQVVINIEGMLQTASSLQPNRSAYWRCIRKVPVNLRNVNEAAYTPQIISIGPLHCGDKKLQPMQGCKISFLTSILQRRPSIKLEAYVKFLRESEEEVRNSYFNRQEFDSNISSDEFVEMMLLDGCFIVELLISTCYPTITNMELLPIPHENTIRTDLMLYENQLPFFLLEQLFNLINSTDDNPICVASFFDLSAYYFCNVRKAECTFVEHFLDLISKFHKPSFENSTNRNFMQWKSPLYLPSATELHASAGVEFMQGKSNYYLDIKSNKNGVLEIPVLDVSYESEQFFANMIAMEQCNMDAGKTDTAYITNYIILMAYLIGTPKDVALLRSKRIINNYLGSDESVAQLFNKLATGVMVDVTDSPYYDPIKKIDYFYSRHRNKWKANFKVKYFQNPWTFISLIAAILLLICTLTQTLCSILSIKK